VRATCPNIISTTSILFKRGKKEKKSPFKLPDMAQPQVPYLINGNGRVRFIDNYTNSHSSFIPQKHNSMSIKMEKKMYITVLNLMEDVQTFFQTNFKSSLFG
jgi:hypothetical protein